MSIQDLQSAGIISPVDIGIDGVQAYTATPPDSTEESQVSLKTYNERCEELNTLAKLSNDSVKEIERLRNEVSKLLLSNDRWEKHVEELCNQNIKRRNQLAEFVEFLGDDFIEMLAEQVAHHAEIDYEELARHFDYHDLAEHIDEDSLAEQVAQNISPSDIAEHVDIDEQDVANSFRVRDIAEHIDYTELAEALNYEETIRDEVRERIGDEIRENLTALEINNVTLTINS
jgi:flagellar motility protein MotE (MotC chaperone)